MYMDMMLNQVSHQKLPSATKYQTEKLLDGPLLHSETPVGCDVIANSANQAHRIALNADNLARGRG